LLKKQHFWSFLFTEWIEEGAQRDNVKVSVIWSLVNMVCGGDACVWNRSSKM